MRGPLAKISILLATIFVIGLGSMAQVLIKPEVPLIVPGTGLGWEEDELRLVVYVEKGGEIEIRLYSPGFDPNDYRSPTELGDERYDGGKGKVEAIYRLLRGDEVLVEKRFGIEGHRWVTFYRGRLDAGEYILSSRFIGNGKNAVIFDVQSLTGHAYLAVAPSSMQTYNVVRDGWQTPFIVHIPTDSPGVRAGIYDGDGPRELQMRVVTPSGVVSPPVRGDRSWTYVDIGQKGRYTFSFRIPEDATQYTNTVGFRIFPGDIRVEVVDERGRPVPSAGYRIFGGYVREVVPIIPDGWRLVRSEIENGRLLEPNRAVFGLGRGFVRFVLAPEAPSELVRGVLLLKANLHCEAQLPDGTLHAWIDGHQVTITKKGAELELPPGDYQVVVSQLPGAVIRGPDQVHVAADKRVEAVYEVYPIVNLKLNAPERLQVGEESTISAIATTEFPGVIPVAIDLTAVNGLKVTDTPSLHEDLTASKPVRLDTTVVAVESSQGKLLAQLSPCGLKVEHSITVVEPPRPVAALDREIDRPVLLPGEETTVCLIVRSLGNAPLAYQLQDMVPDWLLPQETTLRFEGTLPPGETAEHCYRAVATYGEPTTGELHATLTSNAGELHHVGQVRRILLGLSKTTDTPKIRLGEEARFFVTLRNPLDRPVKVVLRDIPDPGLELGRSEQEVVLGPNEEKVLELASHPTRVGALKNRAEAYSHDYPVAPAAEAVIVVEEPWSEARFSTVHIDFAVDYSEGDALLIRHAVPESARYRVGSSRLDGKPLAEPRMDDQGRLYWKIPFQPEGTLTYVLEHESPLGPLADPELTLLVSGQEIPLQGNVRLQDYEEAKALTSRLVAGPTVVATDQPEVELDVAAPALIDKAGQKVAEVNEPGSVTLPLSFGENRFIVHSDSATEEVVVFRSGPPVRAELEPVSAVADGRTPLVYRLQLWDDEGRPAAVSVVTVEAVPEPIDPDADPKLSGYQVQVEGGVALLRLKPMATSGDVRVRVLLDEGLVQELQDYVEGDERTIYTAQGSVTARVYPELELGGLARGYVETPLGEGRLQAALDAAYAAGGFTTSLDKVEDPTGRFPLTGSSNEAKLPLISDDGIAFRYDYQDFSVGYSRIPEGYSALYGEYRVDIRWRAHVGLVPRTRITDRIQPDGSRIYTLSSPAKPGSEAVFVEVGGQRKQLVCFRDYTLDALSGTLYLAYPLWPMDEAMNPQVLVVEYAPLNAPRDVLAFGVSAEYNDGPWGVRAFAGTQDVGKGVSYGLEASYRVKNLAAALAYRNDSGVSFSASGTYNRYSVAANLSYNGQIAGSARIAAELTSRDRIALEHEGNNDLNETRLLYERQFTPEVDAGVGLGYRWETPSLAGVARVGYSQDDTELALTHSQPFSGAARTSLRGHHRFDENLSLQGDVAYAWGVGLEGYIGLDQKVGPANLALSYQLPGASGEGNRARFGVRAPLALNELWSLDFDAGVAYDFDTAEKLVGGGVAARYRTEELSAAVGVDASVGDAGVKLAFRAGATGSLDKHQVISADANFQVLPEYRGNFTLAYAYRGEVWQGLTYHRYQTDPRGQFEGEAALTWHPNLKFQLRPSAAYRIFFADGTGNTFQIGLGANYYFNRRFGIGGGLYYVVQPVAGQGAFAFSVEGSYRVMDPVWLNVGYTFGRFAGVTPEASPGLYVRLDLFGGEVPRE